MTTDTRGMRVSDVLAVGTDLFNMGDLAVAQLRNLITDGADGAVLSGQNPNALRLVVEWLERHADIMVDARDVAERIRDYLNKGEKKE